MEAIFVFPLSAFIAKFDQIGHFWTFKISDTQKLGSIYESVKEKFWWLYEILQEIEIQELSFILVPSPY